MEFYWLSVSGVEIGKRRHKIEEKLEENGLFYINFSIVVHICRIYLRLTAEIDPTDVMCLLKKEMALICNDCQYSEPKTV